MLCTELPAAHIVHQHSIGLFVRIALISAGHGPCTPFGRLCGKSGGNAEPTLCLLDVPVKEWFGCIVGYTYTSNGIY